VDGGVGVGGGATSKTPIILTLLLILSHKTLMDDLARHVSLIHLGRHTLPHWLCFPLPQSVTEFVLTSF
jgi:hypothetical protein